jgi:hypothetical protein
MNRKHSVFLIHCAAVSSSDDDNNCSRMELRFRFTSEQHLWDGLTGSLCAAVVASAPAAAAAAAAATVTISRFVRRRDV